MATIRQPLAPDCSADKAQCTERTIDGSVVIFGPGAEVLSVEPLVPRTENLKDDVTSFVNPASFGRYGGSDALGQTSGSNIERGVLKDHEMLECPLCGTRGKGVNKLSCGHEYCPDCFDHMCASADAPLRCRKIAVTGGKICSKKITLAELETRLGQPAFGNLLQSSLKKYIRFNPTLFLHCSTPNCPQVMKRPAIKNDITDDAGAAADVASIFTCNLCHASMCLTCETPAHANISCAENKAHVLQADQELQLWKKTNKSQDCPNCKSSIEMIEGGCPHMTCEKCGQHFCWLCMKQLDDGRHAYEHNKYFHLGHMP
ncbi:hypothetical protein MMC26_005562 [Xylographa opegraphella]|nr:hypothetical protein [Xylographa opegraphella]